MARGLFIERFKLKDVFIVFNLFIGMLNLYLYFQANNIALEVRKLNEANLGFEIDKRSQANIDKSFEDLYENPQNYETMMELRSGKSQIDEQSLLKVVDVFEAAGSNFCQGTAKAGHIRVSLGNSLSYICNNQEIYDYFGGKKNGTAILCSEFFPDSKFAATLQTYNIHTCEFIDSNSFENSLNRERFEYK